MKKKILDYFFGQKGVLCMFFFTLIGSWEGGKNFGVGIFLNKYSLGLGYRKQTTFLGLISQDIFLANIGGMNRLIH